MSESHEVVVIGDGPAGSALSSAMFDLGIDVVLIGDDRPWDATYACWVDEVPRWRDCVENGAGNGPELDAATGTGTEVGLYRSSSPIDVIGARRQRLDRSYGVFDNQRLRNVVRRAPHRLGTAASIQHGPWGGRVLIDGDEPITARLVVDAAGALSAFSAPAHLRGRRNLTWQTAYGLVLDHRPAVIGGDAAVLMDWTQPVDPGECFSAEPTFLYVVPLGSGRWLVEETSLSRRVPMPGAELRARLTARLGADLTVRAEHVEHVAIPMLSGLPRTDRLVVGFGAAAGYIHPATGYSVTASLRAAPSVAAAAKNALECCDDASAASAAVWSAVWPTASRRSRALHDFGGQVLLRMTPAEIQWFFDAFFALPSEVWGEYLRIDTTPASVSRVMAAVFRSASWSVRRQLAWGDPRPLLRSLPSLL